MCIRDRRSPRGRHAVDGLGARAVEEDHAFGAPRAVGAPRGVADLLRRPARDLDLLQLAFREEGEEPAVGRPEGPRRALGAGQRLRGQRVERSYPDATFPGRVGRIEREMTPVSYTHLRAHETVLDLVCRLLLE